MLYSFFTIILYFQVLNGTRRHYKNNWANTMYCKYIHVCILVCNILHKYICRYDEELAMAEAREKEFRATGTAGGKGSGRGQPKKLPTWK